MLRLNSFSLNPAEKKKWQRIFCKTILYIANIYDRETQSRQSCLGTSSMEIKWRKCWINAWIGRGGNVWNDRFGFARYSTVLKWWMQSAVKIIKNSFEVLKLNPFGLKKRYELKIFSGLEKSVQFFSWKLVETCLCPRLDAMTIFWLKESF